MTYSKLSQDILNKSFQDLNEISDTPKKKRVVEWILRCCLRMPLMFQSQSHIAAILNVSRKLVNEVMGSLEGIMIVQQYRFHKSKDGRVLQGSSFYRLMDGFRDSRLLNMLKDTFPFLKRLGISVPVVLSYVLLLGHPSLTVTDQVFQQKLHHNKNVYIYNKSTKYNFVAGTRVNRVGKFASIGNIWLGMKKQELEEPNLIEEVVELKRKFSFVKQSVERAYLDYKKNNSPMQLQYMGKQMELLGDLGNKIISQDPSFTGISQVVAMARTLSKETNTNTPPTVKSSRSVEIHSSLPKKEVSTLSRYDQALNREKELHTAEGKTILDLCGNILVNPLLTELSNQEISAIFKAVHEHCSCNRELLAKRWKEVGEYKAKQRRAS